MRVGIPRCLSYHYLAPLYTTFLREIGVTVVESHPTTEKDLGRLTLCPTDEPCVSVKVAFCHAKQLLDSGVDALFVPSVISLGDASYCCPKMMGLPAMLRCGLDLEHEQVLSPVIDMKDSPNDWQRSWVEAAHVLGVHERGRALHALDAGLTAWRESEDRLVREFGSTTGEPVTAVMGHTYLLDDIFATKVVEIASTRGPVALPEMVARADAARELATLRDGRKMWTIEGKILGASLYLLRRRLIDRIVFVTAFSCGPASIIENYIEDEARALGIPYLCIAVDEHTGEAGLQTRMEAFLDLARPRPVVGESSPVKCHSADDDRSVSMVAGRMPNPTLIDNLPGSVEAKLEPIGLLSMGNIELPLKTLLSEIGAEIVPAPPLSDDIAAMGKEICPEFICYPMVTVVGQILAHAKAGVKRVAMIEGKGRCRLGWYAQVMQEILDRNGVDVTIYPIDSPFPLKLRGRAALEFVRGVAGRADATRIARAVTLTFTKLGVIDKATDILRELRAREEVRGTGDGLFERFYSDMDSARSLPQIMRVYRQFRSDAREVPTLDVDPIQVQIAGEVYVLNEPFVNKTVERVLGSMEQRVRVRRSLDVSTWANYHLFKVPSAVREYHDVVGAASGYLPVAVGGHGQESVGEAVIAKRHGYDGVLHLFPFTCMPEIIAQNVLVKVSKDLDLPVLSLMVSEQTGVAGLTTRLEAFCDLLDGRRRKRNGSRSGI